MFISIKQKIFIQKVLLGLIILLVLCNLSSAVSQENTNNDENHQETIISDLNFYNHSNDKLLGIEDLLKLAYRNNSNYNISKKDTEIFKLEAKKSLLDFLPKLGSTMNYSYNTNTSYIGNNSNMLIPGVGPIAITGFETDQKWQRNNSVYMNQPISKLINTYHRSKIADINFKNAILESKKQQDDLFISIYENLLDLSLIKCQIEASNININSMEAQYDLANERYKAGTSLLRDAQKVEIELEHSKDEKLSLENNYVNTLNTLKYLVGIPLEDFIAVKADFNDTFNPLNSNEDIELLLKKNKQIEMYENNLLKSQHAKNEFYTIYIPDLSINTNYTNQSGSSFLPGNNYSISFNMEFEFFDWTKRELKIKQMQLEIEKAKLAKQDLINYLKLKIEKAKTEILQSQKSIETEEKTLLLSKSNLDYSLNRYKLGFALISDVLSDQKDVYSSLVKVNEAKYKKQRAILMYRNTLGILQYPNKEDR